MPNIQVDNTQYPIIIVSIHGEITVKEVHQVFNDIEQDITKREGHFVMVNLTSGNFISGDTRVTIGERTNDFNRKFSDRYLGSAIVIESAVSRMMVRGALLMIQSKQKVHLVESMEKAMKLANKWLVKASIPGKTNR